MRHMHRISEAATKYPRGSCWVQRLTAMSAGKQHMLLAHRLQCQRPAEQVHTSLGQEGLSNLCQGLIEVFFYRLCSQLLFAKFPLQRRVQSLCNALLLDSLGGLCSGLLCAEA